MNDESPVQSPDTELIPYIGSKIILAKPMHEHGWASIKNCESGGRDGYLVVYAGGYRSWSPKKEFDLAYRQLTSEEKIMVTV